MIIVFNQVWLVFLTLYYRRPTGESPYKCTQCSRAFVRSTDLQRHLRNHTGEKPYKCKECSRAFARSTDLKRHMRTHTGEKPYKCWQCSKAFSQSGSLQTHLHTHYKESLQIKGVLPEWWKGRDEGDLMLYRSNRPEIIMLARLAYTGTSLKARCFMM